MGNSLAAVHPELIAEWSEKNLPLTPDSITFGSNKKVWWKGACGHEWETSVKARSNGEKCPICSGARVVAGINDLSTLKPELASEWSEENEIKPTEVSIGSHKKVIWKCKLGHEWIATVKSRTINKTGCPYCSHNKVLAGFNDLATLFPEVADEWSDTVLGKGCRICEQEYLSLFPALVISYYANLKGLKVELGSDRLFGIPLDVYIPLEQIAIQVNTDSEKIDILKEHLCKQRGIKLIKLPMKPNEAESEYAQRIKAAFQSVHIFISSDTEEDVKIIRKIFKNWRNSR